MIYIPRSWLKHPDNEERICRIFNECFASDVITSAEREEKNDIPKMLSEMGETEVLRRFENGEIVFS